MPKNLQRKPLKTAWLVTWEWMNENKRVDDEEKIVAILNYRLSGKKVKDFVEQIYVVLKYRPSGKFDYANKKLNTIDYAEFTRIDGVPWHGEIRCGGHPWLWARKVHDLHVVITDKGMEKVIWKEIPRPDFSKFS